MHKTKLFLLSGIIGALFAAPIFADAATIDPSDLTLEQRVTNLELQVQQLQAKPVTPAIKQSASNSQIQAIQKQLKQQSNKLAFLQQSVLELGALSYKTSSVSTRHGNAFVPSASKAGNQSAASLFDQAYALITDGEFTSATKDLQSYIKTYPKGGAIAAAHYWLGEISLLQGQSSTAAKEFRSVVNNFPQSYHAAEALRQLGTILLANGDSQHAQKAFEKVVKDYPNTAAAVLAKKTLETMN